MIEWFGRKPGEDAAVGTDDPSMVLFGSSPPDWVRLPPELGGQQVKVLDAFAARCPRGEHEVRHLHLEGGVNVAECRGHGGFLWYRAPASGGGDAEG